MARIRLLDEDTINKIAAGEVIERPASVVKELVENSIDAGAGRVLIEVADGGKSFIRITDDGCGIDPQDLPLAFQKHATSKISEAGDLENIATLGFRGEALASIASVSASVEVKTKTRGSLSGTYLRMENGKIAEIKEVGSPVGTTITVWDLFYNVPARRKHLKGVEAELVHITDIVTEMAIIHYDISFELFSGKRTIFKSVRSSSWDDVLFRLFGLKTLKGMARLQAEGRGWSLTGVIGDPLSRAKQPGQDIHLRQRKGGLFPSPLGSIARGLPKHHPPGKEPGGRHLPADKSGACGCECSSRPKERSASCMRRRSPPLSLRPRPGLWRSMPSPRRRICRAGCLAGERSPLSGRPPSRRAVSRVPFP